MIRKDGSGEMRGEVMIQGTGIWMTFARWALVSAAFLAFGWKANGSWRDMLDEIRGMRSDMLLLNEKFSTEIRGLHNRVERIENGKGLPR